ncbi:unnamed protein product [Rotaria socialis]
MTTTDGHINGHSVRKLNFGAGPAQLPYELLENVKDEFLNYHGAGANIMELSHRSSTFAKVIQDAEQDIREILSIPESYAVLFLQGGATAQFSAIPLHFLNLKPSQTADYLVTGYWKQIPSYLTGVPAEASWKLSADPSYFYYCANETIHGIEVDDIPAIIPKDVPIVCDMSSNFLTRPFDITKFSVVFASAQKNFGISGVVLVIIRKDLVEKNTNKSIPLILEYKIQIDNGSMYNTPPTFAIYIASKMFAWIKQQGGLKAINERSDKKSSLVYQTIEQSNGFYVNFVEKKYRSRTNIPFRIVTNGVPDEKLETLFIKEAIQSNMIELKGHRAVGGIRVSLYNGISVKEATQLVNFMRTFQTNNS